MAYAAILQPILHRVEAMMTFREWHKNWWDNEPFFDLTRPEIRKLAAGRYKAYEELRLRYKMEVDECTGFTANGAENPS